MIDDDATVAAQLRVFDQLDDICNDVSRVTKFALRSKGYVRSWTITQLALVVGTLGAPVFDDPKLNAFVERTSAELARLQLDLSKLDLRHVSRGQLRNHIDHVLTRYLMDQLEGHR